jgi:hypothetical protein
LASPERETADIQNPIGHPSYIISKACEYDTEVEPVDEGSGSNLSP